MEIRYFQVIVPLLVFLLVYNQYRLFRKGKSRSNETLVISLFWLSIGLLAFFPDLISDFIANIFGIKDNINALIFFALGILFYFNLKLYKIVKHQDQMITKLTRKIAIENHKNAQAVPKSDNAQNVR